MAILPYALGVPLFYLTAYWVNEINARVPEPYLDEVFHVRQAQTYCDGRFYEWDPKITTPPGLYIITWLLYQSGVPCTVEWMRTANSIIHSFGIFLAVFLCRLTSVGRRSSGQNQTSEAFHTAVNVCLFPILFFFSGLYYTDIASTAVVLAVLTVFLQRDNIDLFSNTTLPQVFVILGGLSALCFRQTNVFWVAIFPAALAIVDSLPALGRYPTDSEATLLHWVYLSWDHGAVIDIPVSQAGFGDYFAVLSSLIAAIMKKLYLCVRFPRTNLSAFIVLVMPYGLVGAAFVLFLVWNGGVVLGDKSNHVAIIHFPQMLYIWPNFLFFSWPLIWPHFVLPYIPGLSPQRFYRSVPHGAFLDVPTFALLVILSSFIVYFNTIIHPFTLADNRHYVFYVFRILRLYPALKYLSIPVYILSGWAIIRTTGTEEQQVLQGGASNIQEMQSATPKNLHEQSLDRLNGGRVSFMLVWLATTALCLVTAPLVEPRYLILPWVVWRLCLPASTDRAVDTTQGMSSWRAFQTSYAKYQLWMETAWFLLINGVTGYVFLHRGFSWPQEVGKVQRFLW